jgi:polyisoprenoid-binding protein YceI
MATRPTARQPIKKDVMETTTDTNANHHSTEASTTTVWRIDPARSRAEFAVDNRVMLVMKLTVKGTFSDLAGTITLDEQHPTMSSAELVIGAASLDTKNGRRDKHLKSADFFDVEKYPQLTFTNRAVKAIDAAAGRYRIDGDLTVRGVTLPVTFDALYTAPDANARERKIVLTGTATVSRRDFGMNWQSLVSRPADEAQLTVALEATPASTSVA